MRSIDTRVMLTYLFRFHGWSCSFLDTIVSRITCIIICALRRSGCCLSRRGAFSASDRPRAVSDPHPVPWDEVLTSIHDYDFKLGSASGCWTTSGPILKEIRIAQFLCQRPHSKSCHSDHWPLCSHRSKAHSSTWHAKGIVRQMGIYAKNLHNMHLNRIMCIVIHFSMLHARSPAGTTRKPEGRNKKTQPVDSKCSSIPSRPK
jgi:hypothetical protein